MVENDGVRRMDARRNTLHTADIRREHIYSVDMLVHKDNNCADLSLINMLSVSSSCVPHTRKFASQISDILIDEFCQIDLYRCYYIYRDKLQIPI